MIKDNRFYSHNGILIGNGDRILGRYDNQYEVTVTTDGRGTSVANPSRGHHGDTITMNVIPNAGYELDKHTVNGVAIAGNTFNIVSDSLVHTTFKDATSYDIKCKHEPYSTQIQYWGDHPVYNISYDFVTPCDPNLLIYWVNEEDWSAIGHPGAQRYVVTKCILYLDSVIDSVTFSLTDESWDPYSGNIAWANIYTYTAKGTHKLGLISDTVNNVTEVYIDKQYVGTQSGTNFRNHWWGMTAHEASMDRTSSTLRKLYIETIADHDEALHYALAL